MSEPVNPQALAACRASIELHSKSFSMASKLLPPRCRDDASILYAWCRHADDEIDEAPRSEQAERLAQLEYELDAVYSGRDVQTATLIAFQEMVGRCKIPREYPAELLAGMAMDVRDESYSEMDDLLHYCYRVASTVGLMMCHITGLSRERALRRAAHLGIAMQLTNICRDVLEDWQRGRLYLPDAMLARHGAGALRSSLGGAFPAELFAPTSRALGELLSTADGYYRSADQGLAALPWRAAFGVRAARLIYSDIGRKLRSLGCHVGAGRAVVSRPRKLFLLGKAGLHSLGELPRRWLRALGRRAPHLTPHTHVEFSNDLFCS